MRARGPRSRRALRGTPCIYSLGVNTRRYPIGGRMKTLLSAARVLALDLASTILFLAVYLLTNNLFLAVGLGMALGVAQIGWQYHRRQPIGSLQWLSVVLVLASGTATFLTHDPLFMLLKPSAISCLVGRVILKRGWMYLYL